MISKYFKDFDKKVIKKKKPDEEQGQEQPHGKGRISHKSTLDIRHFRDMLAGVIPSHLSLDAVKPIDSAGFSPDGVDLVAYQKYYPDIINLMGGYVPYELVYGMFHIVQDLDKETLTDALGKTATAKKLDTFSQNPEGAERTHVPSFIVAASSKYQFIELKNDIINYYLARNIDYQFEIDIIMILHRGIVVKNWREKRSFIALETNEDTFMWFFILMNEYLDARREPNIDFRKYVKKEVVYNEY